MKDNKKIVKEIRGWILSILAAFFIATVINSNVFAKAEVQQNSMENTLFATQQLIVDKISYNFIEPKRGDIVIFLEIGKKGTIADEALRTVGRVVSIFDNNDGSNESSRLIKRVIGVAGDEVDIKDGYVYINGKKLEEAYVKGETISGEFKLPIKVGKNELFVLGDNRIVSRDSREFGLIDYKQLEGKAVYRVYPFNQIGKLK